MGMEGTKDEAAEEAVAGGTRAEADEAARLIHKDRLTPRHRRLRLCAA